MEMGMKGRMDCKDAQGNLSAEDMYAVLPKVAITWENRVQGQALSLEA
jgi:hypothetical protein